MPRPANPWPRYEAIKQAWINKHPNATPSQYQEFIRKLTREMRI